MSSADQLNQYKADFDSVRASQSIRISLRSVTKLRLETAEEIRDAEWYNQIWRLQYEFIEEAETHADQITLQHWETEKKVTYSKKSDWSLKNMSVIQRNSRNDYHILRTLLLKFNSESSESAIPHDVRLSTSIDFINCSIDSDSSVWVTKTDWALSDTRLGECDAQKKWIIRTIVEKKIAKIKNQLKRMSYQLLIIIEVLKHSPIKWLDDEGLITFVRQTQVELLRFAEKFRDHLRHQIRAEMRSVSNKVWYLQMRKKKRSKQNYTELSIENDWVSLIKIRKLMKNHRESSLSKSFNEK